MPVFKFCFCTKFFNLAWKISTRSHHYLKRVDFQMYFLFPGKYLRRYYFRAENRSVGARDEWVPVPPDFGRSVNPIPIGAGRAEYATTLILAPLNFRPSYGPAKKATCRCPGHGKKAFCVHIDCWQS
jgi:hypothetical protein